MKTKLEKASVVAERLRKIIPTLESEIYIPKDEINTLYTILSRYFPYMEDWKASHAVSKVKQSIVEKLWNGISVEKAVEYAELRFLLEELEQQIYIIEYSGKYNCWFFQTADSGETAIADYDLQRRYYIIMAPDIIKDEWDFEAEEVISDFPCFNIDKYCFDDVAEIEKIFPGLINQLNERQKE